MKNFHKVRKKREFLFDDKELYALGMLTVIIFVLVFTLGVMVGQTLQEQSVASPLTASDSFIGDGFNTTEADTSQGEAILSNQPSGEEAAVAQDVNNEYQRSYYQVLPDTDTYVEVEVTPAGQVISNRASQPQKAVVAEPKFELAKSANTNVTQTIQEDTPVPPLANQGTQSVPQQMVAMAPSLPSVPKGPDDEMKFGRQQSSPGVKTPLSGMIYSVQVASSPNRDDAERLQQKYGQRGFLAYVMTADLGQKGIWYRVRVGNLQSQKEAEDLRDEIVKKAPKLANQPFIIKVTE